MRLALSTLQPAMMAVLALVACPALAHAQTRTADTVLMSESPQGRAMQEQYGFSDAVIAGDTIYVSGVVAGLAPGETDLKPGIERAFRHIERILRRAGASLADIIDVTSFHTDIEPQVEAMSEVSRRLLGSPPSAWTAVQVVRLLPPNGHSEIKVIARRPDAARTNDARRPDAAAARPGRN